jgi:hypothetical protein
MGNTFGGEHHRPGARRGNDRQRSNSRRQLENWASFDHEPAAGPGCFLVACLTILAALASLLGLAL